MKRLTASFALVTSVLTMPIPAVLAWNIQGHILSGAIAYQIMQRESPIVITTTLILKPAVMPLGFYKLSSRCFGRITNGVAQCFELQLRSPRGLAEYPQDGIAGTKTSGCGGGGMKR